mgnify:FL=1
MTAMFTLMYSELYIVQRVEQLDLNATSLPFYSVYNTLQPLNYQKNHAQSVSVEIVSRAVGDIMMNLNINFLNKNATLEQTEDFMTAITHEECKMNIQLLKDDISRLKTRIANIEKNEDKTPEQKEAESEALSLQLEETESALEEAEKDSADTLEVYDNVISAMTQENHDHFKNNMDVVRTVLRVLATWNNSKLVKYAIIPAFKSPALYDALEAIHVNSKAGEDGQIVMSKEVKEAYKSASKELETIIKATFSLPFETPYTDKTRVKLTAEDKKLLHDSYVKGFRNKFKVDDKTGEVNFETRQVNTLVKAKKNKKTGKTEYDYSALASVICNIVIKHYFK